MLNLLIKRQSCSKKLLLLFENFLFLRNVRKETVVHLNKKKLLNFLVVHIVGLQMYWYDSKINEQCSRVILIIILWLLHVHISFISIFLIRIMDYYVSKMTPLG